MRKCFGHQMTDKCKGHHQCPDADDCFSETGFRGPCDCSFKRNCHVPRQERQTGYYKDSDCRFERSFLKDAKELLEMNGAIIKVILKKINRLPAGQGITICYDGMDGAGKSTSANMLADTLRAEGLNVYSEHFPRAHKPLGVAIYDLLNGDSDIPKGRPDIMQRLYIGDQLLFEQEDLPKLREEYDVIILDRHMFSTLAYGIACGLSFEEIRGWQGELSLPDFTLFFTIDMDTLASRRVGTKLDAFEKKREFTGRVGDAYRSMFDLFEQSGQPLPGALVDANCSIEDVFGSCYEMVQFAMTTLQEEVTSCPS